MTNETHRRGRPSKGIGEHYKQVSVYLPPYMLEALRKDRDIFQALAHYKG